MKRTGIVFAVVLLLLAVVPLWSQDSPAAAQFRTTLQALLLSAGLSPQESQNLISDEVDWERARHRDMEMVKTCWEYADQTDGEIGPYEKVRLTLSLMNLAQEMRSLGFGEPQIVRTALNGTRDALGELTKLQERDRARTEDQTGAGELLRSRIQAQLQTAMHEEARSMVQNRVQAEQDSRPGDLLVPPGPQGPGGHGR
jgi:hypothetical protein